MATQFLAKVIPFVSFRNQVSQNVLTYRIETATDWVPDAASLALILETIRLNFVTSYKECLSQECRYEGVKMIVYDPVNPLIFYAVSSKVGAGPGTADSPGTAPSQVAGLISKKTIRAGRRGRGRLYMPFPPLGVINDDDLPTLAYQVLLRDLADDLIAVLTVIGAAIETTLRPGISSTIQLSTFLAWTAYSVPDGFATQRRRGYFGRPNSVPPL